MTLAHQTFPRLYHRLPPPVPPPLSRWIHVCYLLFRQLSWQSPLTLSADNVSQAILRSAFSQLQRVRRGVSEVRRGEGGFIKIHAFFQPSKLHHSLPARENVLLPKPQSDKRAQRSKRLQIKQASERGATRRLANLTRLPYDLLRNN